ncbi:MAG: radical SAM protein [Leptospirales bacterium]|nr:radical SAM protein [Leptospirales bacterium]
MLILDFYVDEPACFGVPPYLSPYARYVAGALADAGIPAHAISYLTVDQWRAQGKSLAECPQLAILIAGATVPGKYLGGKIGTVAETLEFLDWQQRNNRGGITLLGGPLRYASTEIRSAIEQRGGILVRGDIELYAFEAASARRRMSDRLQELKSMHGAALGARRNYQQVDRWAERGAFLGNLHPNFPYLILELETYRGCTRDVFCSFCTEAFYGRPEFRPLPGILAETAELYRMGHRFFRLGRQADLMTYLPDMDDFQNSFPRPRPESLQSLYSGIRQAAPDLQLLHLDNINPGLIATFPAESREIIRIIAEHNTPGDTAAMGLESADPAVIQLNDLKCDADQAMRAIEIVNEFGALRDGGIPRLLPGINLLHGLPGESDGSFEKNFNFLKQVMDRGLLLRRINIRQTVTFQRTKLDQMQKNPELQGGAGRKRRRPQALEQRFLYYRDRIRKEIDHPMLLKNFPPGVCLHYVILEARNQGFFLGRALGSYPVTCKIPESDAQATAAFQAKRPITAIVLGAEERSLLTMSWPIQINRLGQRALEQIPGLGKKRATRLLLSRPIVSFERLAEVIEAVPFGSSADYDFSNDLDAGEMQARRKQSAALAQASPEAS